ncbi:hypothetical protein QBC45DRAFT_101779 [Copromyces sp. CBS 386.78]|nr:hypothetical protein QBC45DRAFT_101779 [Copromyces sp. CBS 386.78]
MMFSSSNRPNVAEPRYTDVWEDTESDSCGSPLPRVMSFHRRPTEEFNRPRGGISAITRLVAAQRKQVPPNAKPSLLTALLKPSPIVEPLVSPTTTKNPIIFPTNRPGTTRISRGLEYLRSFRDLGISAASNAPVSAESEVLEPSPAHLTKLCEEDDLSSPSPPASLTVEPLDPDDSYEYNQRYRPSVPDHEHQWHPIRESQPIYYAFSAYCQPEQPQESPISESPLFNLPTPWEECFHTRSDSAISGIPLVADAGFSTEAITIAGPKTDPTPPPILRSPPSPTSLIMSWTANIEADPDPDADQDQYRTNNPSSPVGSASTIPKTADPASSSASPSHCTRCVIPLTFDLSNSYLDKDESWECCNCAAKNLK